METAQDIISAIQKRARKLKNLEVTATNHCGNKQSTILGTGQR